MRLTELLLASSLALALTAGAARAADPGATASQPASASSSVSSDQSADAAERLRLARQIYDLSGGSAAAEAQIRGMYATVSQLVKPDTPEQGRFTQAILGDMQDEMVKMVPSIIDTGVQAFADHLTAQELRDYIAWMSSPSGQSLLHKMPAIQADILQREIPAMQAAMAGMKAKLVKRVCDEMKCDADQRQMVTQLMDKAMPPRS